MPSAPKKAPRRWLPRFRFSLRTLVLAVLLIGSGATLWWNWPLWVRALSIDVAAPIESCEYTPYGEAIYVTLDTRSPAGSGVSQAVKVYDSRTGQLKLDLPECAAPLWPSMRYHLSPAGRYVLYADPEAAHKRLAEYSYLSARSSIHLRRRLNVKHVPDTPAAWSIEQGALVNWASISSDKASLIYFSQDDSLLAVGGYTSTALVRMPETKLIVRVPANVAETRLTRDGKWLIHVRGSEARYYATDTGNLERMLKLPASTDISNVSINGESIAVFEFRQKAEPILATEESPFADTQPQTRLADGTVFICDGLTGAVVREVKWLEGGMVSDAAHEVLFRDNAAIWSKRDPRAEQNSDSAENHRRNTQIGLSFGENGHVMVTDAESGRELFPVPQLEVKHSGKEQLAVVASRSPEFLTGGEVKPGLSRIYVWRPRRPLGRLNFLWMPEFWLAGLSALGLGWSLWRDRRMA